MTRRLGQGKQGGAVTIDKYDAMAMHSHHKAGNAEAGDIVELLLEFEQHLAQLSQMVAVRDLAGCFIHRDQSEDHKSELTRKDRVLLALVTGDEQLEIMMEVAVEQSFDLSASIRRAALARERCKVFRKRVELGTVIIGDAVIDNGGRRWPVTSRVVQ